MVVAAVVAALDHRRAAELAAPDDQRVVEQAALLQVLDQRRAGLVGVARSSFFRSADEVAVLVPRLVEDLHEPHAPLDQPAGQQAVVGERRLARLGAVHLERCACGSLRDVHQLRGARSASGTPSRNELIRVAISGSPTASSRIAVELARRRRASRAGARASTPARVRQVRGPGRRRCGTARPGRPSAGSRCPSSTLPPLGPLLAGAEDDEAGQVLRLAAQPVGRPTAPMLGRPNCCEPVFMKIWAGAWLNASVSIDLTIAMSSATVGQVRQQLRQLGPALAVPGELELRAEQLRVRVDERGAVALEQLGRRQRAVELRQLAACCRTARAGSGRRP